MSSRARARLTVATVAVATTALLAPSQVGARPPSAVGLATVEVTGTAIQLEASDGDVFDWAVPWDVWVTLSGKNS